MNKIKIQKLEELKTRIGLVGTRLEVTDDLPGNSFSAHIQNDWKKIRMDYQRELELVPDRKTKAFIRKMKIEDPELKLGEDILHHECGHREDEARTTLGCPHDIITHDRIKSEVARALSNTGKKGQTNYVTNAFEDLLDNINERRHTNFSGQTLFWNNQGLTRSQNQKYNPFYEAFVRMNLFLGGEVKSHTLLSRFFSGDERVIPVVKGVLEDLCLETGEKSSIRLHQKQGFRNLFTRDIEQRRQMWERLAYSFAQRTADLLEETPNEKMFGSGDPSSESSDDANPFDKEMKRPDVQEKIAMDRYNTKKGPSYHTDLQEQLYSFYKATSRDIRIETSSFTASQSMPLVHFGKRFANQDDHKIRFRGIGFDSEGKLRIKTSRNHLDFPASYKRHPTKFPNLKIAIMDRSGSMAKSPDGTSNVGDKRFIPWGDKSKYHFALKGYFGIDNYLEKQGVAPFIGCSVLGLSGEDTIKGKAREVAKKLLYEPAGSHTTLDVETLERELETSALVMSISDGMVSLPSETSTLDEKLRRSDYVHIQIGSPTQYSQYVQSLGKPVLFVRGDEDLSKAMVSFVSSYYQNKGQEQNQGGRK